MIAKETYLGFRVSPREALASEEVAPLEVEGLPSLSAWKKLFINMRERGTKAVISGATIASANEFFGVPPVHSAIGGVAATILVYKWAEPSQE